MSQHYKTPADFRKAFEDRLQKEGRCSGQNFERLRQIYLYERFLARMSPLFEAGAILKGGLALEFRLERARSTKDMDLHMVGSPDQILQSLQEAGIRNQGDYFSFRIVPDRQHPNIDADGLPYGGKRYKATPLLANKSYGLPFGIDVAIADKLIGEPTWVTGSSFFEFMGLKPASFRLYPIETHLAEKFDAYTQPRLTENSRIKDLPDIALIASSGPLVGTALYDAIETVFRHRNRTNIPGHVPDPSVSWGHRYAKLAADEGLPWPTLDILMVAVRAFLDPVLGGNPGHWNHERWEWSNQDQAGFP